jgi:hypothetical protein
VTKCHRIRVILLLFLCSFVNSCAEGKNDFFFSRLDSVSNIQDIDNLLKGKYSSFEEGPSNTSYKYGYKRYNDVSLFGLHGFVRITIDNAHKSILACVWGCDFDKSWLSDSQTYFSHKDELKKKYFEIIKFINGLYGAGKQRISKASYEFDSSINTEWKQQTPSPISVRLDDLGLFISMDFSSKYSLQDLRRKFLPMADARWFSYRLNTDTSVFIRRIEQLGYKIARWRNNIDGWDEIHIKNFSLWGIPGNLILIVPDTLRKTVLFTWNSDMDSVDFTPENADKIRKEFIDRFGKPTQKSELLYWLIGNDVYVFLYKDKFLRIDHYPKSMAP